MTKKRKGFTLIELIVIVIIMTILSSIALSQILIYRAKAISTRNNENVQSMTEALGRFMVAGNILSNIVVGVDNSTSTDVIKTQLVAKGYMYANPKISDVEIKTQFFGTNGAGYLVFHPTFDD